MLVEACGIRPASACSTSPPGPGTSPSAPPRPARRSSRPTSRPENFDGGTPRGQRARGGARLGRGRRRGAAVRRRRVRRRHLVARSDVRPRSPGGRRRARAGVPAGRHDRHDQLHPRGPRRGSSSRPSRLYTPPPPPGALPPAAVGQRGARPRAVRRPGHVARADAVASTWSEPRAPATTCEFFKETFGPAVAVAEAWPPTPTAQPTSNERSSSSPRARTRAHPAAPQSTHTSTCS